MSSKSFMTRAWLVVGLLWVVAMLNYLDRFTITTMRDSIKADIAMTDAQFGLLTSLLLWVYAICSPAAGYLAASTNVLLMAIAGLAVFGLASGFSDANMMPILCQVVNPRYRATATA
ncbi:MAG: hypothetical protein RBU21_13240 [FCB group bacterium]|jgi:sugar phosphate permease|nr:hypothetical protein [FCB group bacterium]